MRMWMVPPEEMCTTHLMGEHVELHMIAGTITKNPNSTFFGYIAGNMMQISALQPRHESLVIEMRKRGFTHKTPFEPVNYQGEGGKVDVAASRREMSQRCFACSKLQFKAGTYLGILNFT